ncbi:MAG: hypothetical protein PHT99_09075, partial [Methanoregula sp.]|nr:hypothetical protein [Methanoregula sp.]
MPHQFRILPIVLFIGVILIAGCTTLPAEKNAVATTSQESGPPASSYIATLNQPNAQSGYVKMDTDIYNVGEVVEFTVTNNGSDTLACAGNPPSFSIKFQTGNGNWATRMGTGTPNTSEMSSLAPGASTQVYRFVTTSWDPG